MCYRDLAFFRIFAFHCSAILLGLIVVLHPTIASTGELLLGDLGDTRFNWYLLEHSFQWAIGSSRHTSFWSPPFFYPQPYVLAYSDTLLSVAPFYWIWRAIGLSETGSLTAWIVVICILNYLSAYYLYREYPNSSRIAAMLAAFFFTFTCARFTHVSHLQLIPQLYATIALWSGIKAIRFPNNARIYLLIASLSASLLFYASFYLAWFTGFIVSLAFLSLLLFPSSRKMILQLLRVQWPTIMLSGLVAIIILSPLAQYYLNARSLVGPRSLAEILSFSPPLQSLLYHGPHHLWYSTLASEAAGHSRWSHEYELGIGVFTMCAASIGLLFIRPTALRFTAVFVLIISYALTLSVPGITPLWRHITPLLPAASAIRAVGRIHIALLVIWGFGLCSVVDLALQRIPILFKQYHARFLACVLFFGIVIGEQIRHPTTFSHLDAQRPITILQNAIERAPISCSSFFYASTGARLQAWKYHLDMIWAGLLAGEPVINGYSGNLPPGWDLEDARIRSADDIARLDVALRAWATLHSLPETSVCWLRPHRSKLLEAIPLSDLPVQ